MTGSAMKRFRSAVCGLAGPLLITASSSSCGFVVGAGTAMGSYL